jgi:signal recognition particle receptor subunit beta
VLSRTDGVVFVADSQRDQALNNGVAFENLTRNASIVGLDLSALPLIVQFNKRDLPNILSEEEIHSRWSGASWPMLFASALEGSGVIETFTTLLGRTYDCLDKKFSMAADHELSRAAFISSAGGQP